MRRALLDPALHLILAGLVRRALLDPALHLIIIGLLWAALERCFPPPPEWP